MRTLVRTADSRPKMLIRLNRYTMTAGLTALCSVALASAANANSEAELFAPLPADIIFADGANMPSEGEANGVSYAVVHGYAVAQGDMVLGKVNSYGNLIQADKRGLGQSTVFDRWTNGIIPYQFSAELSTSEIALAREAIEHWNTKTAVSLVEVTAENRDNFPNYLNFEASNGCASFVGMRGGEQQLWISSGCGLGNIIHEIGHAVGLFHEHTRSDRDAFIALRHDNIQPGKEFNFDILEAGVVLLGEYDYGSIMHYGESFFSANGKPTINVLDGKSAIGQRIALSANDIRSANSLYETDLALSVDARTDSNTNTFRADVQVSNLGDMGAKELNLVFDAGANADWTSMSSGSGWNCRTRSTELVCTLDALAASDTIAFTVIAEANGADENTATAIVTTSTQETEYANNAFNTSVQAPADPAASSDPTSGNITFTDVQEGNTQPDGETQPDAGNTQGEALPEDPNTPAPELASGNPTNGSAGGNTPAPQKPAPVADSPGGGALSPLLLVFALLNVRRWRR